MKRYAFTDSLRRFVETVMQTVAERPKLSCAHDTLSVLGHTGAVIAVCIQFHRVTKYILYRFKVTGSLRLASDDQAHLLEALYYAFCVRLSLDIFFFLNQILLSYKCNVGPSTGRKY